MKIAIDLRALQVGHEMRGIGVYFKEILSRFPFDDGAHEYVFLRYKNSNPLKELGLEVKNCKEVVIKRPEKPSSLSRRILFKAKSEFYSPFTDLEKISPDIFFQPDPMLGLPGKKTILKYVTVYDLIPLKLSELYLPSQRNLLFQPGLGKRNRVKVMLTAWLHKRKYMKAIRSIKKAHKIFSISEATTTDLKEVLRISEKDIITTPLAATVKSTGSKKPGIAESIKNPFLLYLGGLDQRRKLEHLVQAFNLLNGRGYKYDLLLGGDTLSKVESIPNVIARNNILDSSYREQIHLAGFVTEEEKAWLLKNAFAFIYPSLYEGFGLPVLEAMLEGCPVITYDNSSIPEVAGDSAILLKHPGHTYIYKAVKSLHNDKNLRDKLANSGKYQAKKFSWDECAKSTISEILSSSEHRSS